MRRNVARSAIPLAAAVLLGVMPLAAQETGADTAAKNAQGYAPNSGASVGSLASTDPWVPAARSRCPAGPRRRWIRRYGPPTRSWPAPTASSTNATTRQARTEELIQARQRQIAELEVKKKEADKEKRKADKKALDSQQKVLERRKELAVQLKDVNAAEIAAAGKARGRDRAAAGARAGAHAGTEAVGAGKPPPTDPAAAERTSPVIRELERQTLVAQKKAAGAEKDLAGKRDFVASKRLDLYKGYVDAKGLDD